MLRESRRGPSVVRRVGVWATAASDFPAEPLGLVQRARVMGAGVPEARVAGVRVVVARVARSMFAMSSREATRLVGDLPAGRLPAV